MKKILLILFVVIVLLFIFVFYKNNNPKIIISSLLKKGNIASGELRYKISLLGVLPIGEAIFGIEMIEEYKGEKVYHLHAAAQSSKVFSKFFSGSAVLDSYVSIEQLNPIVFKQKVIISGKKDINREVIYDQKNSVMSIAGVKRQILPNTQDPLSAIFNFRRMNFDKIKDFEMNFNTNQKNYILEATVKPKDISVNKKIYKMVILKASIRRRDKNPYHKSNITMVLLSNGQDNVPIQIKVIASGFLINAKLTEIK